MDLIIACFKVFKLINKKDFFLIVFSYTNLLYFFLEKKQQFQHVNLILQNSKNIYSLFLILKDIFMFFFLNFFSNETTKTLHSSSLKSKKKEKTNI